MFRSLQASAIDQGYDITDKRKLIGIGMMMLLLVLHVISGVIPQVTTDHPSTTVMLFKGDPGFPYLPLTEDCKNATNINYASTAFVWASAKICTCIGLMYMSIIRPITCRQYPPIMFIMGSSVISLILQPLFIYFTTDECYDKGTAPRPEFGGGYYLAWVLIPFAMACIVPPALLYQSQRLLAYQALSTQQQQVQVLGQAQPQTYLVYPGQQELMPMYNPNVFQQQQQQPPPSLISYAAQPQMGVVSYVKGTQSQPTVLYVTTPQHPQMYVQQPHIGAQPVLYVAAPPQVAQYPQPHDTVLEHQQIVRGTPVEFPPASQNPQAVINCS